MPYIRHSDGQYPMTEAQVRADFPNRTFPSPLSCPDGYSVVFEAPRPSFNPITHYVTETSPAIVSGRYVQQFSVTSLEADIVSANQAKAVNDLIESIQNQTQARLDDFARTRNYDGILSLCTYATSTVPKFAAEGQCGVNSRDATWATLYSILAEVEAGTRPVPSGYADVEQDLPALAWPA